MLMVRTVSNVRFHCARTQSARSMPFFHIPAFCNISFDDVERGECAKIAVHAFMLPKMPAERGRSVWCRGGGRGRPALN